MRGNCQPLNIGCGVQITRAITGTVSLSCRSILANPQLLLLLSDWMLILVVLVTSGLGFHSGDPSEMWWMVFCGPCLLLVLPLTVGLFPLWCVTSGSSWVLFLLLVTDPELNCFVT